MYIVRTHVVIVFVCVGERGKGSNRGSDDDDGGGVLFTIRKPCEMFAQTVDRPFVVCPQSSRVRCLKRVVFAWRARVMSAFCNMWVGGGFRVDGCTVVVCPPCNPQLRPVHGY